MAVVELTKEQIFDLVRQMPAQEKREMLRVLAASSEAERTKRQHLAEYQLRKQATDRGLVWDNLSPDEREVFIADLVDKSSGAGCSEFLELEKRFAALAAEWKAERGYSSSITKLCAHAAYQQIIGMGEKAIPLLLRELEREPDHWFWALKAITGVNPVPQESRANLREMARHWVEWGHERGYRW
jgi:hypothetical protein